MFLDDEHFMADDRHVGTREMAFLQNMDFCRGRKLVDCTINYDQHYLVHPGT